VTLEEWIVKWKYRELTEQAIRELMEILRGRR
jgi:hypothetical protein